MDIQKLWPKVKRLEAAQIAGGSGYVEPGKVYTYDGKAEDLVQIKFGAVTWTYACIATNAPRLTTVVRAVATSTNGGTEEVTAEEILLETLDDGREVASYKLGGYLEIIFAVWDAGRLYAFSDETAGYLSLIEFAETIHTIDPKFLPGGGRTIINGGTVGAVYAGIMTGGSTSVRSTEHVIPAEEWAKIPTDGSALTLFVDVMEGMALIDTAPIICLYNGTPNQITSNVAVYLPNAGTYVFNSVFTPTETMVTAEFTPDA